MHDPMTVAHEIRWPFKTKRNPYGIHIVTIWHVDPEKRPKGTHGTGGDDSCGWFSPPYSDKEREIINKIVKDQYDNLFAKKVAYEKGQSYAYICYNQDCFGAIYWLWRAMKNEFKKRVPWQYGVNLTNKEFQYVYQLAHNPVDNFQSHMKGIMEPGEKGFEAFKEFVFTLFRAFRRYYRPWYKHPRWHIHHWKIQFHPWQRFYRRYIQKCSVCGKRGFTGAAYGNWDGNKIWCEKCNGSVAKNVDQNLRDTI